MRRMTHAQKDAKIAMLESDVVRLTLDVSRLQRKLNEAQDIVAITSRVPRLSFKQLSAKCQDLNSQGVPCKIRSGHIIHNLTGAILV